MATFEDYRKLIIAGSTTNNDDEGREPDVDADYIADTTPAPTEEEKAAQDFYRWNAMVEMIAPTHPTFVGMGA